LPDVRTSTPVAKRSLATAWYAEPPAAFSPLAMTKVDGEPLAAGAAARREHRRVRACDDIADEKNPHALPFKPTRAFFGHHPVEFFVAVMMGEPPQAKA